MVSSRLKAADICGQSNAISRIMVDEMYLGIVI